MEEKELKKIMYEQRRHHDLMTQNSLLLESGVKSSGLIYGEINEGKDKQTYYKEIYYYHRKGAMITVNGRNLAPNEFSGAADLLGNGCFAREIIPGEFSHNTEYRLYLNISK